MPDREKVIKGLTACRKTCCESCPYNDTDDKKSNRICLIDEMISDALALLKEQDDKIRQLRLALKIMNGNGIRVDTEGQ